MCRVAGTTNLMDVFQAMKDTASHLVRKTVWPVVGRYLRREVLLDTEVYGFPGDGVTQFHHTTRDSRNRTFPCVRNGVAMQIHVE